MMRCGSSFVLIGAQMSTRSNVRGGKHLAQVMKILLKTEEDLDHSQRHNKYWYARVYSLFFNVFLGTQQPIVYSYLIGKFTIFQEANFGPQKATPINTFPAMKSGMKSLDSNGRCGSISSHKAQKRMVCM